MNALSISKRLVIAVACVFIIFFLVTLYLFYQGQTKIIVSEMDQLLTGQSISLSSMVNLTNEGKLDFEFTQEFLPQYSKLRPNEFFHFIIEGTDVPLRSSPNAIPLGCDLSVPFRFETYEGKEYRVLSAPFTPKVEIGNYLPDGHVESTLCTVVGIDATIYRQTVWRTVFFLLPFMITTFVLSLILVAFMVRTVTSDLHSLTKALDKGDFSSTKNFPALPIAQTIEVRSIVNKLETVHEQASQAYSDMILFIARASHQLKTPVAGLRATIDVLIRKERSVAELLEGLNAISRGVQELGVLTQKLISSTRASFQSSSHKKAVDLTCFLDNLRFVFGNRASVRNISLNFVMRNSFALTSDEHLLSEIVGNLIENSILYAPDNSNVYVVVEKKGQYASLIVRDEGPGLPSRVIAHLFEPFIRGDERIAFGSGLGLSIVKSAVNSLGGMVHLTENSGSGAEFEILLPLS